MSEDGGWRTERESERETIDSNPLIREMPLHDNVWGGNFNSPRDCFLPSMPLNNGEGGLQDLKGNAFRGQ